MGRTASDCGRDGRTDRSACTTVTVAVLRPAAPPPPAVSAGSPLLRRSGPSLDPLSPELHAERRRSAHSPRDPVRACIPLYHLAARNERMVWLSTRSSFFYGFGEPPPRRRARRGSTIDSDSTTTTPPTITSRGPMETARHGTPKPGGRAPPVGASAQQRSALPSSSPRGKGCEAAAVLALNLLHRSCAPIGAAMRNSRAGPCLIPRGAAVPRCVVQSGWANYDGVGSQVQQMWKA